MATSGLVSCQKEIDLPLDVNTNDGYVNVAIRTKAQTVSGYEFKKVRIIAFNKTKQAYSINIVNPEDGTGGSETVAKYKLSLFPGDYIFYMIINEPDNITSDLNRVKYPADMDAILIQPTSPFTETNVMMSGRIDDLKITKDVSGDGLASINGGTASPELPIALERVYSKVSLSVIKKTAVAGDKFTIKKVEISYAAFSWLNAKSEVSGFTSRVLYQNNTGIVFENNNEPAIEIVAAIPATGKPSNIIPEYINSDATKVAYLTIEAEYTPEGESTPQTTYYKAEIKESDSKLGLLRNNYYALTATITKIGSTDAISVAYTVKDWNKENINFEIDPTPDPLLDVTNIAARTYDGAATRIYFYTNMENNVAIDRVSTQGSNSVSTNDVFQDLAGAGAANFHYDYNPATKTGEGWFDLINATTTSTGVVETKIYLRADKLVREIAVSRVTSAEAAKMNAQPYVGTFHRRLERSERIVSWYLGDDVEWKAEVLSDVNGAELVIDRLASPFHSTLYTSQPANPEGAYVTSGSKSVEGYGRVYFRVGWESTLSLTAAIRYAKIKVSTRTKGTNNSWDERILYCRQGEDPTSITAGQSLVFQSYNTNSNQSLVDYPTMTGMLFQWNHAKPWAPLGSVVGYNQTRQESEFILNDEVCPVKYETPSHIAFSGILSLLANSPEMYMWGYYADGYFDRRAITNHIVQNNEGVVASAGGLFFSPTSAIGIFLPTASWRNTAGLISPSRAEQAYYWSSSNESTNMASALFLTRNRTSAVGTPASEQMSTDKLYGAHVRCVKSEGNTVYLDANGGAAAPRAITKPNGSLIILADATPRSGSFEFTGWNTQKNGSGTAVTSPYTIGSADVTLYAQYNQIGYDIKGKGYAISSTNVSGKTWSQANAYCAGLNEGGNRWTLPSIEVLEGLYGQSVFATAGYISLWSSTPNGASYYTLRAWDGIKMSNTSGTSNYVRCVREL